MTLNRHRIDGLPKILDRTMAAAKFEQLLVDAGYNQIGSAPLKETESKYGGCILVIGELKLYTAIIYQQ